MMRQNMIQSYSMNAMAVEPAEFVIAGQGDAVQT
jgi:hypothetical protein